MYQLLVLYIKKICFSVCEGGMEYHGSRKSSRHAKISTRTYFQLQISIQLISFVLAYEFLMFLSVILTCLAMCLLISELL